MNTLLKRKVDTYLTNWKKNLVKKRLILKEAVRMGKTGSFNGFAGRIYKSAIRITL